MTIALQKCHTVRYKHQGLPENKITGYGKTVEDIIHQTNGRILVNKANIICHSSDNRVSYLTNIGQSENIEYVYISPYFHDVFKKNLEELEVLTLKASTEELTEVMKDEAVRLLIETTSIKEDPNTIRIRSQAVNCISSDPI